jgi:hypothetical protein
MCHIPPQFENEGEKKVRSCFLYMVEEVPKVSLFFSEWTVERHSLDGKIGNGNIISAQE